MLSGSAWEKVNPELANEIMQLRWQAGKELALSLPTNKAFTEEHGRLFQLIIPSVNVVLSNEMELAQTYGVDDPQVALRLLQADFQYNELEALKKEGRWNGPTRQKGFITFGAEGSYIVTAEEIRKIDPVRPPPGIQLYMGGAGDTAFAAFLLGHINGLSDEISARMAMTLASKKLEIKAQRLPDMMGTLRELMPEIATQIDANSSAIAKVPVKDWTSKVQKRMNSLSHNKLASKLSRNQDSASTRYSENKDMTPDGRGRFG